MDYRQVSADNPISIAKEFVLLDEIERQLNYQADAGSMLALMIAPMNPDYLERRAKDLFSNMMRSIQPWLYREMPGTQEAMPVSQMDQEQLISYYNRVVESARRARALKQQQEEEENA